MKQFSSVASATLRLIFRFKGMLRALRKQISCLVFADRVVEFLLSPQMEKRAGLKSCCPDAKFIDGGING
jgi:hypothetical protein